MALVEISPSLADIRSRLGRVGLFSQTATSTPITNTTTPTSLISTGVGTLSVPANTFQVGDAFQAFFSGVITTTNGQTIQFRLLDGVILLADSGPISLKQATAKAWSLQVNFIIRAIGGAGTAKVFTSGTFLFEQDPANTPEQFSFQFENTTTFDTTITNTLSVTAEWGAAALSNSIYSTLFNLYRIY